MLATLYTAAMAYSLVYLGEHHVIDEAAGVALAVVSLRMAPAVQAWTEGVLGRSRPIAWAGLARSRLAGTQRHGGQIGMANKRNRAPGTFRQVR